MYCIQKPPFDPPPKAEMWGRKMGVYQAILSSLGSLMATESAQIGTWRNGSCVALRLQISHISLSYL